MTDVILDFGSCVVVQFESWHLDELIAGDETGDFEKWRDMGLLNHMSINPETYTILDKEKADVLFIGGLYTHWPKRYELWLYGVPKKKCSALVLFKAAKKMLDRVKEGRIECVVDTDQNARLLRYLKFTCEAPKMKKYMINGNDASLFSLIKGGK